MNIYRTAIASALALTFGLASSNAIGQAKPAPKGSEAAASPVRKSSSPSPGSSSPITKADRIKDLVVTIDTKGFAKKSKRTVIPKQPHDKEDELNQMNGWPEHLQISFDEEKPESWDMRQRQLLVYPVQGQLALYDAEGKKTFNEWLATLKKFIATGSAGGAEIPVLPTNDVALLVSAQQKVLKFNRGAGIRHVAEYGNGDPDLAEGQLAYVFQGLTSDGKYWLSFFHPIDIKDIPKGVTSEKVQDYVNKVAADRFKPALADLDRIVESINLSVQKPRNIAHFQSSAAE